MTHPPSGPSSPPPPPGPKDFRFPASRRLLPLILVAVVLLGDKTPTALCGPPGDTGRGDWVTTR